MRRFLLYAKSDRGKSSYKKINIIFNKKIKQNRRIFVENKYNIAIPIT